MKIKLLIIGNDGCGKSTLVKILSPIMNIAETSTVAAPYVFNELKYSRSYATVEECHRDRVNERQVWKDFIRDVINGEDLSNLAKLAIKDGYDGLSGVRHREEFEAIKKEGLFDYIIWVEGPNRKEPGKNSNELTKEDADLIVYNQTIVYDYLRNIFNLIRTILMKEKAIRAD